MGIDVHALNFLRYANKFGSFGETITLARPGFHVVDSYVGDKYLKSIVNSLESSGSNKYCETLFEEYFGSTCVDSLDNSEYEGATIIHDMNAPIPANLKGLYDTVIDAGTLEHIYNIPQAFKNCSAVCKPGGQIIHVLPANSFCGHGFWQFSPELFFSLYSSNNGYSDTEVFLADVTDIKRWYKVTEPKNGQRVNVHSANRLHVLVRTVISDENFSHENVQQSDYVAKWKASDSGMESNANQDLKRKLLNSALMTRLIACFVLPIYRSFYRLRPAPTMKLNGLNPGLTKHDVCALVE
jgi:SAM-dependent methyltransferase